MNLQSADTRSLVIRWLATSVAIFLVPYVTSGVRVDGVATALFAAAVLGILNAFLKPVLLLLTLPFTILTLGLFVLIINAMLFQLAGWLVPGMHVDSFWYALLAAVMVSIVSWIMNLAFDPETRGKIVVVGRETREPDSDGVVDLRKKRGGKWE
ncbi:phage holin family protein [Thermodesulfobacteriota bacterium]